MGGEGKVVFTPTANGHRVRCDLEFKSRGVALALCRVLAAFQASVARLDGTGQAVKRRAWGG